MKMISLILSIIFISSYCEEIYPIYNNVIILRDETFTRATNEFKNLFVFFYAPWSEECKNIHPEFEMASQILNKENIFLAKIDSSAETRTASKYDVDKVPTFLFFHKGNKKIYNGEKTQEAIIKWVRENSISEVQTLTTKDEIEKLINSNEVSVIYFSDTQKNIEEFKIAEKKINDIPFGFVTDKEIFNQYAEDESIVLFKKFDEKKNVLNVLTTIKSNEIIRFIENYSLPKVLSFDMRTAPIIFGKKRPAVVLFAKKSSPNWNDYYKMLFTIGEKLIGKILVVLTDIDDGVAINLAEFAGLKDNNLPTVKIIDTIPSETKKYSMEGEINQENILKFVDDWEKKKLKPYLKSQPIPKDNYSDVVTLVGMNFAKEVLENDKDVMVYFFAPWCERCKEYFLEYEKVAKKFKKNPKLLMAMLDATENDIENMIIEHYPTIKFYPGNKKNEKPIDYRKKKTESEFISFIKEKASNPIIEDDDKNNKNQDL